MKKKSQTTPIIVGAGGGTLLVVLARAMPDTYPWKDALVLAAPSVSIALHRMCLWLQQKLIVFIHNYKVAYYSKRVKKVLIEAMLDDNLSAEQRSRIKEMYENIILIIAQKNVQEVEDLMKTTLDSVASSTYGAEVDQVEGKRDSINDLNTNLKFLSEKETKT